jgi:hypothetical protein
MAGQSLEHLSVFTIDVMLNPSANENEVITEIDKVLKSLVSDPPEKKEIDRAVNTILCVANSKSRGHR